MPEKFDLTIIGGGPGGYVAAIRAAQLGRRVALVEEGQLGGTCLNRGCIPTKALLHTASLLSSLPSAQECGVVLEGSYRVDMEKAQQYKEKVVFQLRRGVEQLLQANGVEVLSGRGRLDGPGRVRIARPDGEALLETGRVILATGSSPASLPVPGADKVAVINSDGALEMAAIPDSVLIIGGGAVGVEFATIYKSFGSQVVLVEMLPRLIPGEDVEVSTLLLQDLLRRGITVYAGAKVAGFTKGSNGKSVAAISTASGESVQVGVDVVLAAAGRKPNSGDLGLETAGVQVEKGWVVTDRFQRTSTAGVYAIGDVTGRMMLAHVASAAGITAVEHACGGDALPLDLSRVPRCVFSFLEIASVGWTETQAKEQGYKVSVGKFPFAANGKALTMGAGEGLVKVVAEEETGELLGVHVIGPEASSLIMEAGLAMSLEGTLDELAAVVHPHPTLTEALDEAFLSGLGRALHIPPRARRK